MRQENIRWVRETDSNNPAIIAYCGKCQAELAMDEPYTPGLIIVKQTKPSESFPKKLGDNDKVIDDRENLFVLIHEIPKRMRNHLRCTVHGNQCCCTNVYFLSLNENKGNSFLHFRLWPRYDHDNSHLELIDETGHEADALSLMAQRRHQFLIRKSTNCWGNWPPSRNENIVAWKQYALNIKQMIIPQFQSSNEES